jgi:hypothetical protein
MQYLKKNTTFTAYELKNQIDEQQMLVATPANFIQS